MQKIQTANQLRGRATGMIFCAGFGALWLFLSLYARQILNVATVSSVVLGLAMLLLGALYLFRLAKRWPRVPDDPTVGRAFAWINAIQWIAVAVVAYTLTRLNRTVYIPSAITAIVGLHMFPLGESSTIRHTIGQEPSCWPGLWPASSSCPLKNCKASRLSEPESSCGSARRSLWR
jgi:hypothetical protein